MDEKQLQFLFDNYAKGKGFKDINEFRDLMNDGNSRKVFFDESNKELGFKDYDDFETTLDVKKKSTAQPSNSLATPLQLPVQETDVITQSLEADRLGKATKNVPVIGGEMGYTDNFVPDEDSVKMGKAYEENVTAQGYDPKKLAQDFNGIPETVLQQPGFTKAELLDRYKNNPQQYERNIASAKAQSALKEELYKLPNGRELFSNVLSGYNNAGSGDYATQRNSLREIVSIANQYGGEKKDEIVRNLGIDFSNLYGKEATNVKITENDPMGKVLNNVQLAAYHLLEDTQPKELNKYKAAFLDDKDIKDNTEAQLQKQEAGRRLEEIGSGLAKSYAQENLNPIVKEYEIILNSGDGVTATPEQLQVLHQLEEAGKPFYQILENANSNESTISERYPKSSYLDANNFAQELIVQKHTGLDWVAIEAGKATENTAKGVWDFVSEPFRSEQNSNLHQAEVLGSSALSGNSAYLKQGNQTTKTFKPTLSKELQSDVDAIKNDESLSNGQKLSAVSDLLINRNGEWRRTPIENGETNLGITSLMYGVGGLAATLAPFIIGDKGLTKVLGASSVAKFSSAFTAAAATGFHDSYVVALERGSDNPFAEAARMTAINSAAMAGAGTPDAIRKMLGTKTAIGKLVSKMDDAGIMAALKERPKALTAFARSLDAVKGAGKVVGGAALEGFKGGAKMVAFTTGGQIANDAIDNELKSVEDYAKQAAIETLKFTLFGTAAGTIGKIVSKPSDVNLAAISEAGRNPEGFIRALEVMEKNGSITTESAEQVRNNVEKVAKIFKNSPILKNGALNDKQKREYLYNELIKTDAKEAAKTLPTKQAEKAEHIALVADFKNDLILEPKTENQLESRENALEKVLEPKKDESGKTIELNEKIEKETKAELQAISEVKEENKPTPSPTVDSGGVEKSSTKQSIAKKMYKDIGEIDDPTDARGMALAYLAAGNKINEKTINDLAGTVKRASLNTGEKERKTSEVKARDYVSKDGQTIDEAVHSIWDNLPEHIQEKISIQDIKNELNDVINSHNTRLSAATEFKDRYILNEVKANLSEIESKEIDDLSISKRVKALEELPESQQTELFQLLEKYEDKNGNIDWDRLEKDSNGFTPEILSLSVETQNSLDAIISKNISEEKSAISNASDKNGVSDKKEKSEERVKSAQSSYDKAVKELRTAEDKISKKQATQTGMFGESAQKEMFGVNRDEAKSILDPLRQKVKETKSELDKAIIENENISDAPTLFENKPIQNEQATNQQANTENQQSNVQALETQPTDKGVDKVSQQAKKDIGTKARELADKLESGEKSVLPSWMKAKLPPGTKYSGIDIDRAYANALRTFADIHDATKDFAKALEEGFKHIREWFKENNIPIDEKEMKGFFEKEVREKNPPKTDEGSGDRFRDKGILNRLHQAENVSEATKKGFEEKGLKYEPKSQQEAQNVAKGIVEQYGIEDAVLLAEANKFKGGVNSAIFADSLNRIFDMEQKAKTPEEKVSAAKLNAEMSIRYDEWARSGGQDISFIQQFYKKSPLGIKFKEEARRTEAFAEFSKNKDKTWEEFFDELKKEPEFDAIVKEQVREELKKERAEARKTRIAKVDAIFDDAISKIKNSGATFSTFIPIPPKALTLALEGMKKAYHAGEKVAKLVEDAIDYISNEVGGGWDKEKFRKEWNGKLGEQERTMPNVEESYKTRLKNQITALDEQIKNKAKIVKEKKEKNYDDETNDLIKERNEKRKLLNEITSEKTNSTLERFRKKLKGLSEKEKDEVIRRSLKKLVENDALKYDDFKKIIADVLGYGEMTPEQAKKIIDLVNEINVVDELATKARDTDRSQAALNTYLEAKKKAEKSATELGKMVFDRPQITQRIMSIMQLNTLGIPSLINNPLFNVFNQATVRLPRSLVMTAIDFITQGVGKVFGKDIKPTNNVIIAQREFYNKLGLGAKQSAEQMITGLTNKDYFQKEVYTSQIHPATSIMELWDWARGRKRLTKAQVADKTLQGTFGATAEIIARVLNIGDKPQRYATEGAQATTFAKNLGLQNIDYKLFMEFPKEEAYRKFKLEGLSDEVAMKRAEEIQQRIIKEGEESVFQQDNLLNDAINAAFKPFGKAGQVVKTFNMPFVKIPLNAFWSVYNLANPEIALMQSMIYGIKALKSKSALDLQESKKWFAHAVTGLMWMGVTGALSKAGVINASNTDETTKKERQGEQAFEQQNTINMGKLQAYLEGKDPSQVKDGLLVDTKWFGNMGILMGYQATKLQNMTPEQKEKGMEFMEDMMANLQTSALDFMDKGVFSNSGALFTAINKGGSFMDMYLLNLINMGTNIVQPAAYAQISRAQLPYYSKAKADTFKEEVKNAMLSRSSVLRKLTGELPPSKVGIWGDKLDKKDNWMLRLFGMSRQNDDNFAQPLYEIYKKTGNTQYFPSAVKPEVTYLGKRIELNSKQATELEILVGKERKKLVAPFLNDMARFSDSKDTYSLIDNDLKLKSLQKLYESGYETGVANFLQLHPEYTKNK